MSSIIIMLVHRGYADHALLNMTKDQLRAAPEFRFVVGTAPTKR